MALCQLLVFITFEYMSWDPAEIFFCLNQKVLRTQRSQSGKLLALGDGGRSAKMEEQGQGL